MPGTHPAVMLLSTVLAAAATWLAIAGTLPILRRALLAHPNARSAHRLPTPQGGGAVLLAVVSLAFMVLTGLPGGTGLSLPPRFAALAVAVALLLVTGLLDDVRGLSVEARLLTQAVAAFLAISSLPAEVALMPAGVWLIEERFAEAGLLVCLVNITNFIDGLDEISLAHAVPALLAAAALLHGDTALPWATPLALLLVGGLAGFWPWNRHVARLFLGDSGSLPLGLLLGYMMVALIGRGQIAAGLLICLYPVADGFWTLGRRFLAGKRLTESHREHCYQRATDRGLPARTVSGSVFLLELALAGLALVSAHLASPLAQAGLLAVGVVLTLLLMRYFAVGFRRR